MSKKKTFLQKLRMYCSFSVLNPGTVSSHEICNPFNYCNKGTAEELLPFRLQNKTLKQTCNIVSSRKHKPPADKLNYTHFTRQCQADTI